MKKGALFYSTLLILFSSGLLLLFLSNRQVLNENTPKENKTTERKQRGVHVFGRLDSANVKPFVQNNFEWITLVPWANQENYDSPLVNYKRYRRNRPISRDSLWQNRIQVAHDAGLKVFLKPHIWIYGATEGKWRSDIYPTNDENWESWKKSYREFILIYAKIAEENNVEMFCVGTEFTRLTLEKEAFWKSIIQEVRKVYSGKITYAANWYQEYENITFWEELDYIGIQAYFPLVENENPTVKQISKGWNRHLSAIESIQKKYNRKVLFTEMGYKSTPESAIKPWEWIDYESAADQSVSEETQANCYTAFFDTVWKKDWFAGVHIWQMRSDFEKGRGKSDLDFTPQGKMAEEVISERFE